MTVLEAALGGEYRLSDGRVFWMDAQAVAEIMRRLEEIMAGHGIVNRFEKIEPERDDLAALQTLYVEQNQKLGAAERRAADLIAALQDCVNAMHDDNPADGWLEIIKNARAAIASAKSQSGDES